MSLKETDVRNELDELRHIWTVSNKFNISNIAVFGC